jgi:hypothetical protein
LYFIGKDITVSISFDRFFFAFQKTFRRLFAQTTCVRQNRRSMENKNLTPRNSHLRQVGRDARLAAAPRKKIFLGIAASPIIPSPIRHGHRAKRTRIDGHAVRLINRSAENICVSNGPLLGNCRALD